MCCIPALQPNCGMSLALAAAALLQIAEPSIGRSSVVNADGSISDDPSE